MNAHISLTGPGKFALRAGYEHIGLCQGIPSRRFMKATRTWAIPAVRLNCAYLLTVFPERVWDADALAAARATVNARPIIESAPVPSWYKFKTTPRKYQQYAVQRAWSSKFCALFMSKGTGKTKVGIDSVSILAMSEEVEAAVVVTPTTTILNWAEQLEIHSPLACRVLQIQGKTEELSRVEGLQLARPLEWVLVGVESLSAGKTAQEVLAYMARKRCALLIDESQRIKNPDAIRTKQCMRFAALAPRRYTLSGKPLLLGPLDLFAQYELLEPGIIGAGDYYAFKNRYAVYGGYEDRQIVGFKNIDELMELVSPYTVLIDKKDVLPELPDKTYETQNVIMLPEQKVQLRNIKNGYVQFRGEERVLVNALDKVLRAQQVTSGFLQFGDDEYEDVVDDHKNPKMQALLQILADTEEPVIVWCKFKSDWRNLTRVLGAAGHKVLGFSGDHTPEERQSARLRFEAGEGRVFIGSLQAASVGITLVRASLVVYYSNSWELEHRDQSEDRNHRIGQTASKCLYIDLVAQNTVDDKVVMRALRDKMSITDYVQRRLGSGTPLEELI